MNKDEVKAVRAAASVARFESTTVNGREISGRTVKGVLMVYMDAASNHAGLAWPGASTVGKRAAVGERSVRAARTELVRLGWLVPAGKVGRALKYQIAVPDTGRKPVGIPVGTDPDTGRKPIGIPVGNRSERTVIPVGTDRRTPENSRGSRTKDGERPLGSEPSGEDVARTGRSASVESHVVAAATDEEEVDETMDEATSKARSDVFVKTKADSPELFAYFEKVLNGPHEEHADQWTPDGVGTVDELYWGGCDYCDAVRAVSIPVDAVGVKVLQVPDGYLDHAVAAELPAFLR